MGARGKDHIYSHSQMSILVSFFGFVRDCLWNIFKLIFNLPCSQSFVLKTNSEIPADRHIPEVQHAKLLPEELKFVFEEARGHVHDDEEERELTTEDAPHMSQIRRRVLLLLLF